MKYKLPATTFNGANIEPEVDIFVESGKTNALLPIGVYNEIEERVKENLSIENIDEFAVVSKDLEQLSAINITIDQDALTEIVSQIVTEMHKNRHITEIKPNKELQRVIELYNNREYNSAKKLYSSINKDLFNNESDRYEYMLTSFKLADKKKQEDFEALKLFFADNPTKSKELYFVYIKYLEDVREVEAPDRIIKEFESTYPIEILSDEQKSIYYYLKGRKNYGRGEFLGALKDLSLAIETADESDKKLLSDIYNTATNCFTDNLFFEEAIQLAQKAYAHRELLKLPQLQDTISILGGIYLKEGKVEQACKQFKTVERKYPETIGSRGYNYLAKVSVLQGNNTQAKEYMHLSLECDPEDKKGFLLLLKMLLLFKTEAYDALIDLYKTTLLLPENRRDYDNFVVGWGYTLMAEASFQKDKDQEGTEYLYRAMDYFVADRYLLEAYYISLYPYVYSLSGKKIEHFQNLTKELEIGSRFKQYVEKHCSIVEEYGAKFTLKPSTRNNLLSFWEDTKDINIYNYNPESVQKIMDRFYLI